MNRLSFSLSALLTLLWLGSTVAQDQVQVLEDVRHYQSGEARVTVECFAPAVPGKFPAVLLLHGSGGLEQATGDLFREIARGLAQEGYVALIPHYFETTGHIVGKPFGRDDMTSYLDSVHDAIEFAVASGPVDPDRIGLMGAFHGIVPRVFPGGSRAEDQGDRLRLRILASRVRREVSTGLGPPGIER